MMSRVGRSMACGVVAMLREKGGVGRTRCPMSREERSRMGSEEHKSSWVEVDVEKMLADDNPGSRIMEAARWEAQYIYRVPEWLKGTNSKAYQPQLVSLGPFHHGDPNLVPMEEHKSRALVHLVNRSQKPIQDFISAIDVVAEVLQAAYGLDLHFERPKNRRRFVELMLRDGCFLLEMMTCPFTDYELHDPVFSKRSWKCIYSILRSDVLLMENQLPLLVLKKIVGVVQRPDSPAYGINTDINRMVLECLGQAHEGHDIVEVPERLKQEVALDRNINLMVLRFLGREVEGLDMSDMSLRAHPLEIYHGSLTYKKDAHGVPENSQEYKYEIMPSALEIHEAGIKFSKSERDSLLDIHFDIKRGVLTMPVLWVVDDTKSLYLNLMAFERLHGGTGNLVTSYVICMDAMIVSAKDVARLRSSGLLMNMLGCDEETAKLFNGTLNRGQLLGRCHDLHKVQCDVKAYCSQPWHKWRATLMRTHFKNPWALVSLAAAAVLLVATLVQTIYTVKAGKS